MKMLKTWIAIVLIVALSFSMCIMSFAAESGITTTEEESLEDALQFLHGIQNEDGGFPYRAGRESSVGVSSWVMMALKSAGEDLTSNYWKPSGKSLVDYFLAADYQFEETTDYARVLLSLSAADMGRNYRGMDLVEEIISFQDNSGHFAQDGIEDEMINSHMWSVLALESAEVDIPNKSKAKEWLISNQNSDGGFGWAIGLESDTDDTAIAIQALIVLGEDPELSTVIADALSFIKEHQNSDGGYSSSETMGMDSNVASVSWILQSLYAVNEDPKNEQWTYGDKSAMSYLLSMQNTDGSFTWKEGVDSSKIQMTAYAIMSLKQKPIPVNVDYDRFNNKSDIFTDLNQEHWSYEYVIDLVANGVIRGYPNGSFKPDNFVDRGEFTSLIINGLGYHNDSANQKMIFNDVSVDNWAYKYMSIAFNKGIINGRSKEIFDPYGKITGAELATMLVNCLPDNEKENMTAGIYWYSANVNLAMEQNLLYPQFEATENATRAQCAYSIYKIRELLID
jgi:prenyltransferase beta subunit